jgi:hypothetical protein
MRRLACLLLVLCLAAPAGALAQSSPFGPLPQAAPATPAPTPTPKSAADQSSLPKTTLVLIGLGVAAIFVAIGVAITRDARSSLSEDDRRALERSERLREEGVRKQRQTAKTRARAKGRAQRQARKASRRR